MVVSKTGAQARSVRKPGQGVIRRSGMLVGAGMLLLTGWLAGCSTISAMNPVNWWHRQEGGKIAEDRPAAPGADQPYPNISTVPTKPEAPNQDDLKKLTDSLVADRLNAQHAAEAAPLADPSSPTASPALFGVGTAPPPPPPGVETQATASKAGASSSGAASSGAASGGPSSRGEGQNGNGTPFASASMPAVTAPAAPPSPAPRRPVQSTPLEAPPSQGASMPAAAQQNGPAPTGAAGSGYAQAGAGQAGAGQAGAGQAGGAQASAATAQSTAAPNAVASLPNGSEAGVTAAGPSPAMPAGPPPRPAGAEAPPPAPVVPAPMPAPTAGPSATIVFVERASTLTPPATGEVKAFASKRGNGTISVVGYGDSTSSDPDAQSAALSLGLSRAQSIVDALKTAGVPGNAIRVSAEASGRGASLQLLQ
jgi:outer membrane protein OmpA-like peptidoglycan-associated protein